MNHLQVTTLKEFKSITSQTDKFAIPFLQKYHWKLDQALQAYFNAGPEAFAAPISISIIERLFAKLAHRKDYMNTEEVVGFFGDLGVDLADPVTLVISFHFKAKKMGQYSKNEFVQGMSAIGCETLEQLRAKVHDLRHQLKTSLQEIYKYAFVFSLDSGSKSLALENAVELWKILIPPQSSKITRLWLEYLSQIKKPTSISKDTWNMFLVFQNSTRASGLDSYKEDDAWPLLIDEFVAYLRSGGK